MTPRERLVLIHSGQKRKRGLRGIAWAPWVTTTSLADYPEAIKGLGVNGFISHVGGDVYNYFGVCWKTENPELTRLEEVRPDGWTRREYRTKAGSLFETTKGQMTREWRLKGPEDYPIAERIIEGICYQPDYDAFRDFDASIGERGLAFPYTYASPVQELIQRYMGVEGFAYQLADHPAAVEHLMKVMLAKNEELWRIAAASPSPFVVTCENTSTRMISPAIFGRYTVAHLASFAQIVHAQGKKAITHMCGHVHDLLPLIKETGVDGINYLTPPPLGDTTLEDAFAILGDDVIIDAAVGPTVWMEPPTLDEVRRNVERLVTDRILERNVTLTAGADGIPGIPVEKFVAASEALAPYLL